MIEYTTIFQMGGLLLIVYTIYASAYWTEMWRLSELIAGLQEGSEREQGERAYWWAYVAFRTCSALMMLVVLCVVLALYFPIPGVLVVCKWILLVPLACLLYVCARFVLGHPMVPPPRLRRTDGPESS